MLVLDAVDQTAGIFASDATVLLMVKRDAVRGALVAEETNGIEIERPTARAAFPSGDNPVRCAPPNVDAPEQRFGGNADPRRDALPVF